MLPTNVSGIKSSIQREQSMDKLVGATINDACDSVTHFSFVDDCFIVA